MRARLAALAVVPLLMLAACGGGDEDEGSGTGGETLDGVSVSGSVDEAPAVEVADQKADETTTAVIEEGDGPPAATDAQSLVHVSVFSGKDGYEIFSSWDNGQPQLLTPGGQELLPGLNGAIDGQPRGSRIALEIPAVDVLTEAGLTQYNTNAEAEEDIEPLAADDAIIVVVDIMSVEPTEVLDGPEGTPKDPPAGVPGVVEEDGNVTGLDWTGVGAKPKELQVVTLTEGDGPAIEAGRLVTFDYFGEVWKGDEPFDESYSKEPITFPVGVGSVIPAWDEGLVGVKQGSRVLIIAPPDQAYGKEGRPPQIPGNSTLAFVIDVLGVDG